MNIIHPGDHVILTFAANYGSSEERKAVEESIKDLPNCIPPEVLGSIVLTFMPIAPKGAQPQVLFVIRQP